MYKTESFFPAQTDNIDSVKAVCVLPRLRLFRFLIQYLQSDRLLSAEGQIPCQVSEPETNKKNATHVHPAYAYAPPALVPALSYSPVPIPAFSGNMFFPITASPVSAGTQYSDFL